MKKSFILHIDSLGILDKLSNEQAGILLKAFCEYHKTGIEPVLDFTLELVFFNFKAQFERDFEKYEKVVERNTNNGKKGGRPKETETNPENPVGYLATEKTQQNPTKPKKADSVNDSVNDSESVNENKSKKESKFNFLNSLIGLGIHKEIAIEWIEVRTKKGGVNTKTAFDAIAEQIKLSKLSPTDSIKQAVIKNWVGFKAEWIKETDLPKQPQKELKPWETPLRP